MELEDGEPDLDSGEIRVNGTLIEYMRRGATNEFDLWSKADLSVADIECARDEMQRYLGVSPTSIYLGTIPRAESIIENLVESEDLRGLLDEAFQEALRIFGLPDGGRGACDYGMPSEYRGWLAFVRKGAEKWIARAADHDELDLQPPRLLAREIVILTHALNVAMRYGTVTLPYTTGVALQEMNRALDPFRGGRMEGVALTVQITREDIYEPLM